jgi:hypothetical protein
MAPDPAQAGDSGASLLFAVPTDTLRHVLLFLHGSLAFRRRGLRIMRITFLRRVREILLLTRRVHTRCYEKTRE